jgi:hypothetical protein
VSQTGTPGMSWTMVSTDIAQRVVARMLPSSIFVNLRGLVRTREQPLARLDPDGLVEYLGLVRAGRKGRLSRLLDDCTEVRTDGSGTRCSRREAGERALYSATQGCDRSCGRGSIRDRPRLPTCKKPRGRAHLARPRGEFSSVRSGGRDRSRPPLYQAASAKVSSLSSTDCSAIVSRAAAALAWAATVPTPPLSV